MFDITFIECAIARSLPWLDRVERLPGGGAGDNCGFWHGTTAANEAKF